VGRPGSHFCNQGLGPRMNGPNVHSGPGKLGVCLDCESAHGPIPTARPIHVGWFD
jgi:hypothetical protein